MSDIIPGNTSTNTPIAVGSSVSGRLDFNGDTDWYRVQLQAGFGYQIWLEAASSGNGTLLDPYLAIYNSAGTFQHANNDSSFITRDAYLTTVPNGSGTFYISAEEFGNNGVGSYRVTAWLDQLANNSSAATIAPNSLVTDRIGWSTDYSDWYVITLTAGVNYQFDLTGSALHGESLALADPFLVLRNASGTLLLSDDDGGNALDSRIFFTPTVSGTYLLDVQESGVDGYGVYSLIVNEAPVSGTLQVNVPWQDAIAFQGDFDLLAITLTSGISYGFSIDGQTLADPVLELMDSNGIVIASDDDNGPGLNSLLAFTPTASGTYYLAARAANHAALGSYTARAWELPNISVGDASVVEGNSSTKPINFPVTLSKASPVNISFTIGTRAGTAWTATGDYEGIWETTLTILAGQTSAVFSIPVYGDTQFEPNEGFSVVISNPVMATIADGNARGWIFDDDAPYTLPSDPLSRYQWHLYPGAGANVLPVWDSWDGSGIKVAVFDQGIDSTHPDLNDNLLISLGRRASNLTAGGDPILAADNHGTPVAGVIAAEANGSGVIGVAPQASLVSIYSTLASSTASFGAEISNAFAYAQSFDVLNNSWGFGNYSRAGSEFPWAFLDNFRSPTFAAAGQALKGLAENGRNGFGTVVVQSAGNSFSLGDDTNLHNFQNSRYIITVAGTDYQGTVTSYSSPGASVLISAPGGEVNVNNDALSQIFTTDRVGISGYDSSDYTFIAGTSFSGPVVSGVVALMLDANPTLGYRDVQQIIAYSGRRIAETENDWKYNGAANWNGGGLHYDSVNHNLGFGLIDALAAVRLAESWSTPSQTSTNDFEHSVTRSARQTIPDGASFLQQSVSVTQAMEVERVEVTIDISHTFIGDLEIGLTSPAGTNSWLLSRPGKSGDSLFGQNQDNINFTFNTVLSWGENSVGTWTLSIADNALSDSGTLNSWTLNLIGKPASADDVYVYTNEFSESVADQTNRATLTDTGGIDHINASAVSTATSLNLQAGSQSTIDGRSLAMSAGTLIEHAVTGDGNDVISGNQAANSLRGMRGDDLLSGGEGHDSLEGGMGNDFLDGGLGIDLAIFNGLFAGYRVERSGADYRIVDIFSNDSDEGTDILRGIEEAKFSDATVQLASLDLTPPTVSIFNPADGTGSVAVSSNITITFNESIQKGAGNIEIRQGSISGTLVESFNVITSERISVSESTLTIDPTSNMSESVQYFLVIPNGSIRDLAGNNYGGINTYDFTANTSPIATGSSLTTNEDTAKTGALAGTDVEGSTLTFAKVTDPTNGTVTVNASTGAYTYTPKANYNGSDSFTFKVNDGTVDSTVARVSITVASVNDVPLATAASVTTNEDTAKSGTLAGTDVEGNSLTFAKVSDPTNGTVTINASTGAYTYTSKANYNGSDSFTFKVNDGAVDSAVATVSITVAPVNDVPLATAASVTTDEDTAKSGTLAGTDVEGVSLTFAKVTDPANGTVTINASTGAYTYTPKANFNGSDNFTFKVNDGTVDSTVATVSITVAAVNDMPLATAASVTTDEDRAKSGTLAGTDVEGGSLTFAKVADPANGAVTINASTGAYTYTPKANFNGSDSFTFKVNDGTVDSAVATVSITVAEVNDVPLATAASVTTDEDTAKSGTLAGTDVEDGSLSFAKVTDPANGTVTINASTGAYTYTPKANFNGSDNFTFKVNDGTVDSETASVSITVQAVNDTPNGSVTISGGVTQDQVLTAANTLADVDGIPSSGASAITYQWLADGEDISGATSTSFTLTQAQMGRAISVRASYTDALGTTESVESASIKINTPPVARDNSYTITEDDTQVVGNLITDGWAPGTAGQTLFRDTDADGDALSISAITVGGVLTAWANLSNSTDSSDLAAAQAGQPWKAIALPNGTAWLQASGNLRYAGKANETLGDTLSYTITDGQGGTASAQAQIKVLPVDDPTSASLNISGSAKTGGSLSLNVSNINDPDGTPSLAYQWQWLNNQTWQNIDGATSDTWVIPTGGLWADRAVRAQLSTTDPLGGTSVFHSDAQTIEASSQLVLGAAHWKSGKALPGVGLGLFDGATELKTGSDGKLSAQGFQDPDGVDDGQTVLNPTLAADPKKASITLTDVLGALKVYLGKPLPEAYNNDLKFIAADFDGNGTVNLTDVLGLLKFYLNKPVNAAPAWVFVDSAETTTFNGQTLHLSSKAGQTLSTAASAPSPILADLNSDESVQLLGVLRGDVDGSWVG